MPKLEFTSIKPFGQSSSDPWDHPLGGVAVQEGGPDEELLLFQRLLLNKVHKISGRHTSCPFMVFRWSGRHHS